MDTPPRDKITLISHHLCPYVQRAVIALTERGIAFDRIDIDLADKPAWFLAISPLGKTPVLRIGKHTIFESSAILEYLEDTQGQPLHPSDPLERARHRAWMTFGAAVLDDIAGFYSARDPSAFEAKTRSLEAKFSQLEEHLGDGPYFAGSHFSLVDAVWGPVFRYFDVFDAIGDFRILTDKPGVARWRDALKRRPSIAHAVAPDYAERLREFLVRRNARLSELIEPEPAIAQHPVSG